LIKGVVSCHLWPWSPVMIRTLIGSLSAAKAGKVSANTPRVPAKKVRRLIGGSFRQDMDAVGSDAGGGPRGRRHRAIIESRAQSSFNDPKPAPQRRLPEVG